MSKFSLNSFQTILTGYCMMIVLLWLTTGTALAQDPPKTGIKTFISTANRFIDSLSIEKLYLQTDKPYYSTGDTLWFKAYLLDAYYLDASTKSGVLYLELANDSNRVIERVKLPVYGGISYGQINLGDGKISQGHYTLRAYTSWMRNFGENYTFKKSLYVTHATDEDWLIGYHTNVSKNAGKDELQLGMTFNRIDKTPVGLREMEVRVTDGKRTRYNEKVETNVDGLLTLNLDIPPNTDTKNLSLVLQDKRDNHHFRLPLILNQPKDIDLQFMPEGGNIVAGLPGRIAFKAINEEGKGTEISGQIVDSQSQEVVEFRTTGKGMGTFTVLPRADEIYLAKLKLPDGSYKSYPLPTVKNNGTTLQVNNLFQNDSIEITMNATSDIISAGRTYYLTAQVRGIISYGAALNFNKGPVKLVVSKKIFPTGIIRFTLADEYRRSLNERITFVDRADNLNIQLTTNKAIYRQRDSIHLEINVSDKNGNPVQGSFSLAVTDNEQVKKDSITNGSILTQMLLATNLRGDIEDPGYYLKAANDPQKWQNLDHLLLAQGWVGYDWSEAFKPENILTYAAEREFSIRGRVTDMFHKPVSKSGVTLLSKKPILVMDTITNAHGAFAFTGIFPVDTAVFFIQARNRKGKSFNVGIEMEEFKPPIFTLPDQRSKPWFVNVDTTRLSIEKKQLQLKNDLEKITGMNVLNEVVVTAKKVIKESHNLNGAGEADLIIDEEELGKRGRTTLGDLLEEKVEGFGPRMDKYHNTYYKIYDRFVHLIIDGTDTEFFWPEGMSLYDYQKQYFDYYDAEEILGIEVMRSSKYANRYWSTFLDPLTTKSPDHAFIEVTTRGGRGPFVKKSVGTNVYKPLAFTLPKKFYSPKYDLNTIADMTDIRSTIYWEPNIVTDKNGKASLTFYAADNPGSYSLIIEGSDMQGKLGVKRATIVIER